MENKENSGDSANSTSSEEHSNKPSEIEVSKSHKNVGNNENKNDELESSTQDLSLRLELDESGSLKLTQDEYRMFSRIESSSEERKVVFQSNKETQDFQLSKSMDGPYISQNIESIKQANKADRGNCDVIQEIENAYQVDIDSKSRSSVKRHLDSQGIYSIRAYNKLKIGIIIE